MIELQRQIRDIQDRLERLEKVELGGTATTFTPTYNGTTPGVTTYSTQTGSYIRIGNLVIATMTMVWTNATGTGSVRIGGLPFTSATGVDVSFGPWTQNVTFANGSVQGVLQGANSSAQLFSPATNAAGTELTVEVAGTLRLTIVYFTE